MAAIRGNTYDHMVEHLPSVDKLGNQFMVTPIFAESKDVNIIKVVGRLTLLFQIYLLVITLYGCKMALIVCQKGDSVVHPMKSTDDVPINVLRVGWVMVGYG